MEIFSFSKTLEKDLMEENQVAREEILKFRNRVNQLESDAQKMIDLLTIVSDDAVPLSGDDAFIIGKNLMDKIRTEITCLVKGVAE